MSRIAWMPAALAAMLAGLCLAGGFPGRADEPDQPKWRQDAAAHGLRWLAEHQYPDGHWEGDDGELPVAMTSLAGIALLMDGGAPAHDRYAENVRKAADWLAANQRLDGLIGGRADADQWDRYMIGHGFAVLFLSQVRGEKDDAGQPRRYQAELTHAVDFLCKAQARDGGWGEFAADDAQSRDIVKPNDGSNIFVTLVQYQALRAAREAGFAVPKTVLDRAREFLGTTIEAYEPADLKGLNDVNEPEIKKEAQPARKAGDERDDDEPPPPEGKERDANPTDPSVLRAAAVAVLAGPGPYDAPPADRWLKDLACPMSKTGQAMETKLLKALEDKPKREKIRAQKELGRQGDQWDEKTVRYLKRLRRDHAPAVEALRAAYYEYCGAQLAYDLGDHGCAKLFPDVQPPESLTWSGYRKRAFERIRSRQRADGGWGDGGSEVHATALTLMILRLEDEALPALSR